VDLILDEDVRAVAAFMQERISVARLVAVASGVAALAPLLWGRYQPEELSVLRLVHPAISDCGPPKQSASSEQIPAAGSAGGGSAAA
jgi:hypothetical protein